MLPRCMCAKASACGSRATTAKAWNAASISIRSSRATCRRSGRSATSSSGGGSATWLLVSLITTPLWRSSRCAQQLARAREQRRRISVREKHTNDSGSDTHLGSLSLVLESVSRSVAICCHVQPFPPSCFLAVFLLHCCPCLPPVFPAFPAFLIILHPEGPAAPVAHLHQCVACLRTHRFILIGAKNHNEWLNGPCILEPSQGYSRPAAHEWTLALQQGNKWLNCPRIANQSQRLDGLLERPFSLVIQPLDQWLDGAAISKLLQRRDSPGAHHVYLIAQAGNQRIDGAGIFEVSERQRCLTAHRRCAITQAEEQWPHRPQVSKLSERCRCCGSRRRRLIVKQRQQGGNGLLIPKLPQRLGGSRPHPPIPIPQSIQERLDGLDIAQCSQRSGE